MRILGIDYGDKKVGFAVSDLLNITAQGLEVLRFESEKILLQKIDSIVTNYKIEKFVIGFPKNMDGTIGFRAEKTLEFVEKLKKNHAQIPTVLWDERLTTAQAKRVLIETNVKRKNKNKVEDKIAAIFILQSYMDTL